MQCGSFVTQGVEVADERFGQGSEDRPCHYTASDRPSACCVSLEPSRLLDMRLGNPSCQNLMQVCDVDHISNPNITRQLRAESWRGFEDTGFCISILPLSRGYIDAFTAPQGREYLVTLSSKRALRSLAH